MIIAFHNKVEKIKLNYFRDNVQIIFCLALYWIFNTDISTIYNKESTKPIELTGIK